VLAVNQTPRQATDWHAQRCRVSHWFSTAKRTHTTTRSQEQQKKKKKKKKEEAAAAIVFLYDDWNSLANHLITSKSLSFPSAATTASTPIFFKT
jgi:hypothetical protein